MTKYIAYYRVSTTKQGQSGLGLDAQKNSIKNFTNSNTNSIIEEFTDIESGKSNTKNDRFAAKEGNIKFNDFLQQFQIHKAIKEIYSQILKKVFIEKEGDHSQKIRSIEKNIQSHETMIRNVEDKIAKNELQIDLSEKMLDRYSQTICNLKVEKLELQNTSTNYNKYLSFGINFLSNLSYHFKEANLENKNRILRSIFTEKLEYLNGEFRT